MLLLIMSLIFSPPLPTSLVRGLGARVRGRPQLGFAFRDTHVYAPCMLKLWFGRRLGLGKRLGLGLGLGLDSAFIPGLGLGLDSASDQLTWSGLGVRVRVRIG